MRKTRELGPGARYAFIDYGKAQEMARGYTRNMRNLLHNFLHIRHAQ